MPHSVTVRAPATSANLGAGFDAVGLALHLFAEITVALDPTQRSRPPTDPVYRMVKTAINAAYRRAERAGPRGLQVTVRSEIPLGRGLGASAAARGGGIVAANALLGGLLGDEAMLELGTELEGHADNIAPALFGGLQVTAIDGARVARVAVPLADGLHCVAFVPTLSMPTHETRRLLPKRLSLGTAVHNSSRAALLVAALTTGRWEALDVATDERLHQRPRSKLFPQMYDLFAAARRAGAFAAYLSGGGSTIMALTDAARVEPVRDALTAAAAEFAVEGRTLVLEPSPNGVQLIAQSG